MHIEAAHGTVLLKLGSRLTGPDAERLGEAVESLAPFSQLVVDFSEVREFHDTAFFSLSRVLGALPEVKVVLRGITLHQARVLKYLATGAAQPPAA